jgi:hypothetical protein
LYYLGSQDLQNTDFLNFFESGVKLPKKAENIAKFGLADHEKVASISLLSAGGIF